MPIAAQGEYKKQMTRIEPCSAKAFELKKGQFLTVVDTEGQQVADLVAYNKIDIREYISSGRSIDYASKLFLTTGDLLYSNRSNPMLEIINDDVGRHDFTLTPCSKDTFRIIYGDKNPLPGCQGNLEEVLEPFGIIPDQIPIAFNIFMNVSVDASSGEIAVLPPLSRAGDKITFVAKMDLLIGLTACSAGQSNNFKFKPIDFEIE
ncbi:MAG: urea carboxylase-associated family protein [Nitrosomonas sp.]|uniref:urea carboxylase-associated family protein n=1 Tax=Nitrosomonas sp. TaxID=42353 RepID=UPI002733BA90|nr:urea carboxylase-associated family protein [Nitrosomonas sp.]MDP3661957.1 urea carboxylase-associated family protein [Nitrosomonas sp.]MDZ4106386.1 urea carboxylase-associated family protein [Nitrosomonas sp.]